MNVPGWPRYSFDLNLLEESMVRPENGNLAMINKKFDRA
jgi:hypothetical protein